MTSWVLHAAVVAAGLLAPALSQAKDLVRLAELLTPVYSRRISAPSAAYAARSFP